MADFRVSVEAVTTEIAEYPRERPALAHPGVFFDYYANDTVALASRAWFGPNYQVTWALNADIPGREDRQEWSTSAGRRSPRTATITWVSCRWRPRRTIRSTCTACPRCSPCTVPWRTATCRWKPGLRCIFRTRRSTYPATWRPTCRNSSSISPKLRAIALGHARDGQPVAGVVAFGRAMETVDRTAAIIALYPTLLARSDSGASMTEIANVIAASAEGYPFPTNLDLDQPIGSLNPETQAELDPARAGFRLGHRPFRCRGGSRRSSPAGGLSRPHRAPCRLRLAAVPTRPDGSRRPPDRSTTQVPPETAAREARLCRPLRATVSGIPMPLSVTSSTRSAPTVMVTPSSVAAACRTVLLTASRSTACACCARSAETMSTRPEKPDRRV